MPDGFLVFFDSGGTRGYDTIIVQVAQSVVVVVDLTCILVDLETRPGVFGYEVEFFACPVAVKPDFAIKIGEVKGDDVGCQIVAESQPAHLGLFKDLLHFGETALGEFRFLHVESLSRYTR